MFFKDDYKFVNDKITASDELKKLTLEKINTKKQFDFSPYLRYGLVCASFLFVVAIFPVLYGIKGVQNDKSVQITANGQIGEKMPQTGVDDVSGALTPNDAPDSATSHQGKKELIQSSSSSDKQQSSEMAVISEPANEPQSLFGNMKNVESALSSRIKPFALAVPVDNIVLNEIKEETKAESKPDVKAESKPDVKTEAKPKNFTEEEGYTKEQLTDQQVVEYLGASPVPSFIPPDLTTVLPEDAQQTQTIVYNKEGSVVYDTFTYTFLEPQLTKEFNPQRRILNIYAAKDKLPPNRVLYLKEDFTPSMIKGCEVKLGLLKQAYAYNDKKEPTAYANKYVAEFTHINVGYQIVADNLTQAEFIDIISSIIAPNSAEGEQPQTKE